MSLHFYEVQEQYTMLLRQVDNNVRLEHADCNMRKFIGVVFKVGEIQYFAPLSSPKPKHARIPSKAPDIYKIDGGVLGVINLNNMIPVPERFINKVDVDAITDPAYRNLLKLQLRHIRSDAKVITKKAAKLYKLVTSSYVSDSLKKRCCNFALLDREYQRLENDN